MRENLEQWQRLCQEAVSEQDPVRLMQLVEEINRLLREKEQRLIHEKSHQQKKARAA